MADPELRNGAGIIPSTAGDICFFSIYKLALSSSPSDPNCVVIVVYGDLSMLAYARPGDESWTELQTPFTVFCDVIYHEREGRFFALSYSAGVVAIDFPVLGMASPGHHGNSLRPKPTVRLVAPNPSSGFDIPDHHYLVALPSGKILVVWRFMARDSLSDDDDDEEEEEDAPEDGDRTGSDEDCRYPGHELGNEDNEYSTDPQYEEDRDFAPGPYRTANFKVFLLEAGEEREEEKEKQWVRLHSIGNCSLLLGYSESMSILVTGDSTRKYRPNSIYFTDDEFRRHVIWPDGGHDCGIFQIQKKTLEFFFPVDTPRMVQPPMWIVPSG